MLARYTLLLILLSRSSRKEEEKGGEPRHCHQGGAEGSPHRGAAVPGWLGQVRRGHNGRAGRPARRLGCDVGECEGDGPRRGGGPSGRQQLLGVGHRLKEKRGVFEST
jgi:hypothetical protein